MSKTKPYEKILTYGIKIVSSESQTVEGNKSSDRDEIVKGN